ncbi:MAG: hypothetical protein ABGW87_03810 [Sphingomonadaceae bacterium]
MPDLQAATNALHARSAVLAFPAEEAIPLGFERIDPTRAWSGMLRTRGECVARLLDMPSDIDMASALLRIALQSGSAIVELDSELLSEKLWQRAIKDEGKGAVERRWLRRHLAPAPFLAPGLAIAERAGMRLSHDVSGSRKERVPLGVAVTSGVLALGSGLLGHPAIGLAIACLGAIAWAVAAMFDRVSRVGSPEQAKPLLPPLMDWVYDGLVLYLLTVSMPEDLSWMRLYVPAMLLSLLRLGQTLGRSEWRTGYGDRITLLALLTPLTWAGYVAPACAILSLLILVSLFLQRDDGELTGA